MSEANKQLVRRWFEEVWNQRRESLIDVMLTADVRAFGLGDGGATLIGPEGFKTFYRSFSAAFPDLHITVHDMIAEGDKVAVRWSANMTHLGNGLGFPPSGKKAILEGTTIVTIKDGRIDEGWNYMDMTGLITSLKTQ